MNLYWRVVSRFVNGEVDERELYYYYSGTADTRRHCKVIRVVLSQFLLLY